jgi:ribosomal 30S subunit maturation factor RimM
MTYPIITEELIKQLDLLPLELQKKVLDFAKALTINAHKGTSGREILSFAGVMDRESVKEITEAVRLDCEQVDTNEW